jgi:ethylbenzene dioxygenase subunit beta
MTSETATKRKPDYSTYPTLDREQATAAALQLLALSGDAPSVDAQTLHNIEAFYYREARLLDEKRYLEWYDTLSDDLFYWLPLRENRYRRDKRMPLDPNSMAMFDERKADIAVRIGRTESNLVWSEDPPTRHVYVVTNIEAFETATPGEYEVHSAFVQYRNRSEHDEATLIGRRRDVIRATANGFLLARRLILLTQSVLLTKNLSVFF